MLRRNQIRIFDFLNGRLAHFRSTQRFDRRKVLTVLRSVFIGTLVGTIFIFSILPSALHHGWMLASSALLVMAPLSIFWFEVEQLQRWEIPVIRLLRASHGYFVNLSPFCRVLDHIKVGTSAPVDDFKNIIESVKVSLDGEIHSSSLRTFRLSLYVALAAMFLTALALKPAIGPPRNSPNDDKSRVHLLKVWVGHANAMPGRARPSA
jgi:hypothetical protein